MFRLDTIFNTFSKNKKKSIDNITDDIIGVNFSVKFQHFRLSDR